MYQGALNFGILKAVFCIIIDSLGYASSRAPFLFFLPFFFFAKRCGSTCVLAYAWLRAWGRTIKYTNFPAKYMNSRSKFHWNIHVVLCQVSVTWNKRRGIGIPELRDHAERHSAFNTSSKWNSLIFYFYDIFFGIFPINVMFASILTLKTSTKLALITKL